MPDVDVFDAITITEFDTVIVGQAIEVNDSVSVAELVARIDGVLFVVSNIIDFTPVSEFANLTIEISISVFEFIDAQDEQVSEVGTFSVLTVGNAVSGFDLIPITEFVLIGRTPLEIFALDNVNPIENVILGLNVFDIETVFDDLDIIEIVFLVLEIDLAFDSFLRSYPFIQETGFNVLTQVFENGSEQRRDKWGRPRKRFSIVFSPRPKSEIDDVQTFYVTKSASAIAFNFTNPLDSQVYLVRFEENTLQVSRVAFGIFQATVNVVEVF